MTEHQDWEWWKDEAYRAIARAEAAEKRVTELVWQVNNMRNRTETAEKREAELKGQWERLLENYASADARAEAAESDARVIAGHLRDAEIALDAYQHGPPAESQQLQGALDRAEAAEKALEPFAAAARHLGDDVLNFDHVPVLARDCRNALAALEANPCT